MGNLFNIILVNPITNILLLLYFIFQKIGLPGAFGFSIVSLTALVRLVMQPFYSHQTKMSKQMADLKPHLDELSKKHKDDKKKLQQEQMRLYQEKGINPASGCLLAILQIPIFIGLYNVLNLFLQNGKTDFAKFAAKINKIVYIDAIKVTKIDPWFFGFNLAVAPSQYSKFGYHYLLIPVLTAVLQYYQIKMSMPSGQAKPDTALAIIDKKSSSDKDKKEVKNQNPEDFQKMMASQMKIMFPVMIGYFSFIMPVGLSIYWNIFSLFTLLQKKN